MLYSVFTRDQDKAFAYGWSFAFMISTIGKEKWQPSSVPKCLFLGKTSIL